METNPVTNMRIELITECSNSDRIEQPESGSVLVRFDSHYCCVSHKWSWSGPRVVREWSASGQCVVSEWSANGQCVVSVCSVNGQRVVSEWSASGQCVVSEWSVGGK